MFVIAVTGRLASGKSTVSRLLSARGGFLIDADVIAKEGLKKGTLQYFEVVQRFGKSILNNKEEIERRLLARKAFSSTESLKKLEAIVHPFVREEIRERIISARKDGWRFAVIDLPLVAKSGLEKEIDYIIFVDTDTEKIIERARGDGMDKNDAIQRLGSQPTTEELEKISDYKIDNNSSLDILRKQVEELFSRKLDKLIKK